MSVQSAGGTSQPLPFGSLLSTTAGGDPKGGLSLVAISAGATPGPELRAETVIILHLFLIVVQIQSKPS